jgi:hypothetical protein
LEVIQGSGKTFFLIKRFFSKRKDGFSASLKPSTFSKKKRVLFE